jgi:hypothetical protein
VLSSITIIRQWRSDRVKVKLSVRRNRQIVGDPKYAGLTLMELKVTNVARRPVTITTFGAVPLHPHPGLVAVDTQPQLPHEIHEGQYISSYWPQADLDFSKIDYWAVWDSQDRIVARVREAGRFRHWKSVRQQKREWRKKKKAEAASAK